MRGLVRQDHTDEIICGIRGALKERLAHVHDAGQLHRERAELRYEDDIELLVGTSHGQHALVVTQRRGDEPGDPGQAWRAGQRGTAVHGELGRARIGVSAGGRRDIGSSAQRELVGLHRDHRGEPPHARCAVGRAMQHLAVGDTRAAGRQGHDQRDRRSQVRLIEAAEDARRRRGEAVSQHVTLAVSGIGVLRQAAAAARQRHPRVDHQRVLGRQIIERDAAARHGLGVETFSVKDDLVHRDRVEVRERGRSLLAAAEPDLGT